MSRLEKKDINPHTQLSWLRRNGIERPFKYKVVSSENLCDWSDGSVINDFTINICDAILELSYMRSHIASHKMNEKVLCLTVYDAVNAFNLARVCLLQNLQVYDAIINR